METLDIDADTILENIRSCPSVEKANSSKVLYALLRDCNGHSPNSNLFILSERDSHLHYTQYDSEKHIQTGSLKPGEISVPVCFQARYDCQIGIAYRQFISEKKQYLSAIFVTALLSMCIILVNDSCAWFGEKENLNRLFDVASYDLAIDYDTKQAQEKAEKRISEYTDFVRFTQSGNYLLFNNLQMYCKIIDEPEQIITIQEGRTCLYDNEVLITQYLADGMHLSIGDEASVKKDGHEETFIVCGIYEYANDIAKNFAMNYNAYQKFIPKDGGTDKPWGTACYQLADKTTRDAVLADLKETFDSDPDITITGVESMDEQLSIIADAVNALAVMIYLLGSIFVMITVSIVCGKIITKEKRSYGIYKSLGFTSALIPIPFMTVLFALCAYWKARRVKKVEPRILIAE